MTAWGSIRIVRSQLPADEVYVGSGAAKQMSDAARRQCRVASICSLRQRKDVE